MPFGGALERTSLSASRAVFVPAEEGWTMKGLFIVFVLLVVVVVGVVGLGFYLGWFHLSTGGTDSTPSATITVDQNKIEADKKAAQEKVKELEEKAKEKTNPATDKGKEEAPKP
jgi:flagellar basal body-associated protein FliL